MTEKSKKLYRQGEIKRIQQQQTNLARNTKGIYIASKHKKKERLTQTQNNQEKANRHLPIGTCVSMITLNVNGLNAPTKRYRLTELIQKQDPYIHTAKGDPLQT